jgi:hypothetical protein
LRFPEPPLGDQRINLASGHLGHVSEDGEGVEGDQVSPWRGLTTFRGPIRLMAEEEKAWTDVPPDPRAATNNEVLGA